MHVYDVMQEFRIDFLVNYSILYQEDMLMYTRETLQVIVIYSLIN